MQCHVCKPSSASLKTKAMVCRRLQTRVTVEKRRSMLYKRQVGGEGRKHLRSMEDGRNSRESMRRATFPSTKARTCVSRVEKKIELNLQHKCSSFSFFPLLFLSPLPHLLPPFNHSCFLSSHLQTQDLSLAELLTVSRTFAL
jgi:hypothetical protein